MSDIRQYLRSLPVFPGDLPGFDADGDPSARVLILKNVDEHGWQFAVHAPPTSSPARPAPARRPRSAGRASTCKDRAHGIAARP